MRSIKSKSFFAFAIIVMIVVGLFQTPTLAADECYWCSGKTCTCQKITLDEAISGRYKKCEIQIIRKTYEGQKPEKTGDNTNIQVKIPVEANDNDMFMGIRINLSQMKNVKLTFYDSGKISEIIESGPNPEEKVLWSSPAYSDKVTIEVEESNEKNSPLFCFDSVKYNKSVKDPSGKRVAYQVINTSHNPYSEEVEFFKKALESLPIDNLSKLPIEGKYASTDFEKCNADVLYQTVHGNEEDGPVFQDKKPLEKMVNQSSLDWIYLKSCRAVNVELASKWCDYLMSSYNNTPDKHITKGIFGYSESMKTGVAECDKKFLQDVANTSQIRPMLDSYLGAAAQIAESNKKGSWLSLSSVRMDRYPYITAIINENNLRDSMFQVSETQNNTKYRYYKLSILYDPNEKFDEKSFYRWETVVKEKQVLEDGQLKTKNYVYMILNYPSSYVRDEIEVGENKSGKPDREFVLDFLNNSSLDDFEAKMKYTSGKIPQYVKEMRGTEQFRTAYKKLFMHYTYSIEGTTTISYAANKPQVSIEKSKDGYYVAEYALLEKKSGQANYSLVMEPVPGDEANQRIVWTKEVLRGYKKEVPWYTKYLNFIGL